MSEHNTLFLLCRFGISMGEEYGTMESRMWLLTPKELSMKYVSFHKTKSDRAYRGGEIIDIRDVTEEEVEAHQILMAKEGLEPMVDVDDRKVIVFRLDQKWNKLWPASARSNPMAYKGTG